MVSKPTSGPKPAKRSIQPLIWILVVCLAPVVLAFMAYYLPGLGLRPDETTNYGTLVNPQRPVPDPQQLGLTTMDGEPFDLQSLRGKWVLATADSGACDEACVRKLFILRNSHASQGKNVDRLTRVWFVTDDKPIPQEVLEAYQGTIILRADPAKVAPFLTPSADAASVQTQAAALAKPMWIIDPISNLMLEFPPDADPLLVRKDISKLLHSSRIG